ncbi:hypothetical protein CBS63078_7245 [Aspergillus niger]|uniref:Aldehyde dehydrogenase family protein n=2 Tax=Aspergillus niger TaxID=5061 RepID=A0A254UL29_ASPNG|nr:hypothetical protein ASPNIDRAFT_209093 [Aspergillus niger ATCC 1015]KAI2826865.1 hypothetical protein CBS133816_7114 [Aspergillus niger]KAI2884025.1 hypothetical protein CBS11852_8901 [Aspergillus niger]KAI2896199.1 hypothetical protein CBS13152_3410 [Aspergillus niger]KAI2899849.1 hypothetical protein CBS63078_7245 [Aspergillus niger]
MASSLSKGPVFSAIRSSNAPFSAFYPGPAIATPCQRRYLSQSSQRSAGLRGMPQNISMPAPAQPSMRTRGRGMPRTDLPQDIGLLPGTFIRPLWRDMPSIFQQPSERLHMEWLWIKSAFQNFIGVLAYCKWLNKGLALRLKERRQIAAEYHKKMYTAFAAGDIATLRKVCCTGLANQLSTRIAARPKGERVTWNLDSYIRSPGTYFTGVRVMSDRATQIPEIPNSGVRQVVLRITSRQSKGTTKASSNGAPADSTAVANNTKQQDCTEYLVIQQFRWAGEEDQWRVWGHATPTTVEDLESPFFARGMSLADRMEAMRETMTGKK